MRVFLDFEASSLAKRSYPIEVAWVFADGRAESHLIRPPPEWTDWDEEAEAIHGLARTLLEQEGEPHDQVAARMVEELSGHDLFASAPSWDAKWLNALLRTAGYPKHRLRLRKTSEMIAQDVSALLGDGLEPEDHRQAVERILADIDKARPKVPAHRALPDAQAERGRWLAARQGAEALLAGSSSSRA
ncbi:3'-5' exonuclease [Novosphingobium lindaniclasticum]|uniref:Uncharacterized protein n=1 Tax=Novosphingobium lindaniclasticum LE124 TaxID=1096930 RepID=T0I7M7_9SPHN|nr:hypothetical protein [Novosphingobium lindaniclasticum]EQB07695.1 hypothetical protein L284_22815 [Novosphingobium lindaniclasticum LE124]